MGKEIGIQVSMTHAWSQASIDNVRLVSVVPEPAALGMLGLAAILGLRRSRRPTM